MEKNIRKDALSLLPYEAMENNKNYANISEFFIKESAEALDILSYYKIEYETMSDYELLCAFVKTCIEKGKTNSNVYKSFENCVHKLVHELKISSENIDEIWSKTGKALMNEENSLVNLLKKSDFSEIGFAAYTENKDKTFMDKIGKSKLVPVFCPFGIEKFELKNCFSRYSYKEFVSKIEKCTKKFKNCAVFARGFEFVKPNEFSAEKTYKNMAEGRKVTYDDENLLNSQLFRSLIKSVAENGAQLSIFLPDAKHIYDMAEILKMLDYIEECNFDTAKITLFAKDAVALSFAFELCTKKYKKTDATTGICGSGIMNIKDIAESCGFCKIEELPFASLAKTAYYL